MAHKLRQSLTVQIEEKRVLFDVSETSDNETPDIEEDVKMNPSLASPSDFSVPLTELLFNLTQVEDELVLEDNGYEKTVKIRDTLQGELMEGLDAENNPITIKKCDKVLVEKHLSFPDDDDMEYYVDDDVLKEAQILKRLTSFNHPFHINYVDLLESDTDFYLITESTVNGMSLLAFTEKAHEYILDNKLSKKHYHKSLKYIFWQLSIVLNWLHNIMHC